MPVPVHDALDFFENRLLARDAFRIDFPLNHSGETARRCRERLTRFTTSRGTQTLCTRLLHDVRQLVRDQPSPLLGRRGKPPDIEHNGVPHRVGMSIDVPRGLLGDRTGMHSHAGKVVAKTPLHVLPQRRFQRPAGTGKDFVNAVECRVHLSG